MAGSRSHRKRRHDRSHSSVMRDTPARRFWRRKRADLAWAVSQSGRVVVAEPRCLSGRGVPSKARRLAAHRSPVPARRRERSPRNVRFVRPAGATQLDRRAAGPPTVKPSCGVRRSTSRHPGHEDRQVDPERWSQTGCCREIRAVHLPEHRGEKHEHEIHHPQHVNDPAVRLRQRVASPARIRLSRANRLVLLRRMEGWAGWGPVICETGQHRKAAFGDPAQ
jgi:hypothetical protein